MDGWITVGSTGRPSLYTGDTTKLKADKEDSVYIAGSVVHTGMIRLLQREMKRDA
jgi:hypothetical protein